jgi:hypothetical protein
MVSRRTVAIGAAFGLIGLAGSAHATVYFSADAVRHQLFPSSDRFVDAGVTLTTAQVRAIASRTRTRVRSNTVPIWRAMHRDTLLGHVIIDQVLGKHEYITYAVALDERDVVRQIEVMEFRETYGDEIRNGRWRAQFDGKHEGDALQVGRDIVNISGATLSCVHITDGVRRLLATFAIAVRGR